MPQLLSYSHQNIEGLGFGALIFQSWRIHPLPMYSASELGISRKHLIQSGTPRSYRTHQIMPEWITHTNK